MQVVGDEEKGLTSEVTFLRLSFDRATRRGPCGLGVGE
jgi:hypothetical protein